MTISVDVSIRRRISVDTKLTRQLAVGVLVLRGEKGDQGDPGSGGSTSQQFDAQQTTAGILTYTFPSIDGKTVYLIKFGGVDLERGDGFTQSGDDITVTDEDFVSGDSPIRDDQFIMIWMI